MPLTASTAAATRATDVETTDEESDNALFTMLMGTIFTFGVLVGGTGYYYYRKLAQTLRTVVEKQVRNFGTMTDPVPTPTTFSPSSFDLGPIFIATRFGVC